MLTESVSHPELVSHICRGQSSAVLGKSWYVLEIILHIMGKH
jgi:hypothetical protein